MTNDERFLDDEYFVVRFRSPAMPDGVSDSGAVALNTHVLKLEDVSTSTTSVVPSDHSC